MQEVFKPNPLNMLTLGKINSLLVPEFSPVNSNRRTYEAKVHMLFCKYMREVACEFIRIIITVILLGYFRETMPWETKLYYNWNNN